LPVQDKVLVSIGFIDDPTHGSTACETCHGGDTTGETRALAHVGMIADPTVASAATTCGQAGCHAATVASTATSLHTTLAGIRQSMLDRAGGSLGGELTTAFTNHCARCHSSCGDCHVSTPAAAGGGLLSGHVFRRTPPMATVCTACHGSRVGNEFRGENYGIGADTHYNRGMQCVSCHSGGEMHNTDGDDATHRYQVDAAPKCEDCHPDDSAFQSTTAHGISNHRDATSGKLKISCYVCHAQTYKNCASCHVSIDAETGKPVYDVNGATANESVMTFKIGYNPSPDALHPETWVLVRHVPIDPDNFAYYGADLLTGFDSKPTWVPATPHNIKLSTPQNASCMASCHNQRDLFLADGDLAAYEVLANQPVVVPDADLPQ